MAGERNMLLWIMFFTILLIDYSNIISLSWMKWKTWLQPSTRVEKSYVSWQIMRSIFDLPTVERNVPIYPEHDEVYLAECLANLEQKEFILPNITRKAFYLLLLH